MFRQRMQSFVLRYSFGLSDPISHAFGFFFLSCDWFCFLGLIRTSEGWRKSSDS